MTAFLGKRADGRPLLHLLDGAASFAEATGGPAKKTVFHSDLPYLLVTYDEALPYSHAAYGAKFFTIPQSFKNHRASTKDAFFVVLTDSSGRSWLHDPSLNIHALYQNSYGGSFTERFCYCANGLDYASFFVGGNAEVLAATNNSWSPSSFLFTFRTYDTADNYLAVARPPVITANTVFPWLGSYGWNWSSIPLATWTKPYTQVSRAGNPQQREAFTVVPGPIQSVNNDVVGARLICVNIRHTPADFSIRALLPPSYSISVSPSDFRIGGVSLDQFRPLRSHGLRSPGSTGVAPRSQGARLVSAKPTGQNSAIPSKINQAGSLIGGNGSPVLEFGGVGSGASWATDFSTNTITRSGVNIVDALFGQQGIFLKGSRRFSINTSFRAVGSRNYTRAATVSSLAGSFTGTRSDDLLMLSIVSGGQSVCNSVVSGFGTTTLFRYSFFYDQALGAEFKGVAYLNVSISQAGSISAYWHVDLPPDQFGGRSWAGVTHVDFDLPSLDIRVLQFGTL